jgi:hypothetical protein
MPRQRGDDPGVLREFAPTAEELGFTHIVAYDHAGRDPGALGFEAVRPSPNGISRPAVSIFDTDTREIGR